MTKWQELIKRYADGKPICNCDDGYYSLCGHQVFITDDGRWEECFDAPICRYGCSANRAMAKEYIATKVLEELGGQMTEVPKLNSVKRCPACDWHPGPYKKFSMKYVQAAQGSWIERACPTCKFSWYEKTAFEVVDFTQRPNNDPV